MSIESWSCIVSVQVERKISQGVALDTITIEEIIEAKDAIAALDQIRNTLQERYNVNTNDALVMKMDISEPE